MLAKFLPLLLSLLESHPELVTKVVEALLNAFQKNPQAFVDTIKKVQ